MSRFHIHLLILLGAFLVWVFMLVFSHEYVSHRINQNNLIKIEQAQQLKWHLRWPMLSDAEIVTSFLKNWEWVDGNIQSTEQFPELSLQMNGEVIDPSVHQQLMIDADIRSVNKPQGTFKLEFSNQQQQVFYVSNNIPIKFLNESLNLNTLDWRSIHPDNPIRNKIINTWSDIQILNAFVIRFKFEAPVKLVINNIQVNQTLDKNWDVNPKVMCQQIHQPASICWVTNQMRYLQSQQRLYASQQLIGQQAISESAPAYWLLISAVLTLVLLWVCVGKSQLIMSGAVAVFVFIGLIHSNWIAVYFELLKWPLLVLFMALLWQYKSCLKAPTDAAKPVWVISILLSVALLFGFSKSELGISLVLGLPQYLLWAVLQQLLIGPWASDCLYQRKNAEKWQVACVVGVFFSIIHAPNHGLMLATLFGGGAWSYAWLKYRNLYANAVSHAILALAFYQAMPDAWLGSARVGVFF